MIATSLLQGAATVAAVATALVAIAASVEKVFSPLGKWFQKWLGGPLDRRLHALQRIVNSVDDRTQLLADDVSNVKTNVGHLRRELEEHRSYTYYHLGPNGSTTPVHTRLERLEKALSIEDSP